MAEPKSLKNILNGAKPDAETPDDEDDIGRCGMVQIKGCRALDIERGAEPVISLQYVYLGVRAEFTPTRFWVEFIGLTNWKVTVEGRNLRALFDRLNDHCLRRIRTVDRDFDEGEGKPVVTRIKVEEISEKDEK